MALGTNQMTVTTQANQIPEIWTRLVQVAVERNLVAAKLCKRLDDETKDGGDTLHIPSLSNLTANAMSANSQVTLNAVTEGVTNINLNRYFECSFLLEKIAKIQSSYNLQSMYTEKTGYAIALQIDTDMLGLYSSFTQAVGAGNTALTVATWTSGVEYLDVADAPDTERYAILHPTAMRGLRNIAQVIELQTYGKVPTTLETGAVGRLFGVDIYTSNNVQRFSSPFVTYNLMFHREAWILAMQQLPTTEVNYIPQFKGTLVSTDAIWGYTAYRTAFGVQLVS